MELGDRLMRRVRKLDSGCWEWTGTLAGGGYGQIQIGGRSGRRLYTHRVAYELWVGPIGDLHCLHRCDHRQCINPEHLFLGTNADNVADKVSKRRQHRGDVHPLTKLPEDRLSELFELRASGMLHRELSDVFGISKSHVSEILSGNERKCR